MKFVELTQIRYDDYKEKWEAIGAIWINMEHVHYITQESPGTWMAFSPVSHEPRSSTLWDAGYRVKEDVSKVLAKI